MMPISQAKPFSLPVILLGAIAAAMAAVLFGLLATTASPMLIGLGVGLVGGAILLAIPKFSISMLLTTGLLMGALVSFSGPVFGKLPWALSLLGMLLLVPVFLNLVKARRPSVPPFVWIALAFIIYAVLATVLNWDSFPEFIAGFKRYFQVFGLMLALAVLPLTYPDFRRWQTVLLVMALMQFPFALYELLVLVPQRGGVESASYTTDVVAGTFGANLEGGSPSATMALFLLITFGFLFSRWRNGLVSTAQLAVTSLFLLLPLGMGETKIAMVMLPLVWLVLVRHDVGRSPVKYLPVLLSGLLLTAILGYIYVELIMESTLADVLESTISYNFAEAGYASYYLNRTTVLSFWWSQQGLHDPVGFFFGNGLGSSFLGQISGHIGMRYPYHGVNLTAASTILWDLGIVGLGLFVAIFVSAWRAASRLYLQTSDLRIKADLLAIQASIALFMLFIVYSQDIVNLIAMEIIYSAVLGYLAFLYSSNRKPLENSAGAIA